ERDRADVAREAVAHDGLPPGRHRAGRLRADPQHQGRAVRQDPAGARAGPDRRLGVYFPAGDAGGTAVGAAAGADVAGAWVGGRAAGRGLATGEGTAPGTRSSTDDSLGLTSDSPKLVTMKAPARIVVARDSTLAEPRGPKAVWVPPPPKALARSWPLPCCRRTTPIRNRHEIRWSTTTR